mgnify:CR=1 FL=1
MIDYILENKDELFGIVTAVIDWLALNVFKAKEK